MRKNDKGDQNERRLAHLTGMTNVMPKGFTDGGLEVVWIRRSRDEDLANAPKSEHHDASASEEQQDTEIHVMSKKPFDPSNIMGFCTDTSQLRRASAAAATYEDSPVFTTGRAAAIRAYTADWMARHEPAISAGKVEAYLGTCKPFDL